MPRVIHFDIDSDEPERAISFYGGIGKRTPEGLSFTTYRLRRYGRKPLRDHAA